MPNKMYQEQYVSLACRVPFSYKLELLKKAEKLGVSLSELVCNILSSSDCQTLNVEEIQKLKSENEKLKTEFAEQSKSFEEKLKQKEQQEQEQMQNLQFLREENQSLQAQISDLESQIQSLQESQKQQEPQAPSENLQEQVQEVQQENQEQQEQIEALQQQVQDLQNEPEPEPATEPTPTLPTYVPKSKDEAILHQLYQEGVRYITKPELKALGFNTGFWSNLTVRGAKYGKYELKKRFSDKVFNIVKLA